MDTIGGPRVIRDLYQSKTIDEATDNYDLASVNRTTVSLPRFLQHTIQGFFRICPQRALVIYIIIVLMCIRWEIYNVTLSHNRRW